MALARLSLAKGLRPAKIAYYAQRLLVGPRSRRFAADAVAAVVRLRWGAGLSGKEASGEEEGWLRALRALGYTRLGALLNPAQVTDIRAFLAARPLTDHDDPARTFLLDAVPPGVRMANHRLEDVLACPHVLQLANRPALLNLAAHYLGCTPTLSALRLRWSFPGWWAGTGLQAFHRDLDDWRFVKLFVYLSDVDEGSGPYVQVAGTHLTRGSFHARSWSDREVEQIHGAGRVVSFLGGAGTGLAADSYGLHKGAVPRNRRRLQLQLQYSLLPVYAYRYEPRPYHGPFRPDPYVNRLFLRQPAPA